MPDQPLILLVEDEEHIAQGLLFNLEAEGYRTHHEADGDAALAWLLAASPQPAAVLLDVMLPGRDGFSVVHALREAGLYTPVLMLTARGRSEDVVEGFEAGADDYVAKPFDLGVLLARLASLLRRIHWQRPATAETPAPEPRDEYVLGDRIICFDTLEIRAPGKLIHLTLMEADLLRYLIERPGKIISRKEILENVWRVHEDTDTRAIDNFIVRLRRHLEPDPSKPAHLLTVRGIGYRFMAGETALS
ncbi:MAG TPA: response regulator transcription factor [Acidobacteriaceae bacterium]|nr:response regulator transcription factor [Acidobacteriaceae bacterium]